MKSFYLSIFDNSEIFRSYYEMLIKSKLLILNEKEAKSGMSFVKISVNEGIVAAINIKETFPVTIEFSPRVVQKESDLSL